MTKQPVRSEGLTSSEKSQATILLSGGLDSATILAVARDRGYTCYALSFDYGQRHSAELTAAADYTIAVPSFVTARVQEIHILAGHALCAVIESTLAAEGEGS